MNDVNEERNATSDVGRLAILISELQRDVMEMGKHLGIVMQRLQSVDLAAGQRLARLESTINNPQGCCQTMKTEGPKVVDLKPSASEIKAKVAAMKVEMKEVDRPVEKEPA